MGSASNGANAVTKGTTSWTMMLNLSECVREVKSDASGKNENVPVVAFRSTFPPALGAETTAYVSGSPLESVPCTLLEITPDSGLVGSATTVATGTYMI